ncbi:MAG: thioredoxin domain-containing protein [Hyphomicrobiales bacterium]
MDRISTIVFYFAKWEPSCDVVMEVLKKVETIYQDRVAFVYKDVDQLGLHNNFQMIPAICFERDSKVLYKHIGLITKDNLIHLIDTYLL